MQSVFAKPLLGICAATAMAALMAAGAAVAQTTDEAAAEAEAQSEGQSGTQPASEQTPDAAAETAGGAAEDAAGDATVADLSDVSAETVVATVAGTPITLGELIVARRSLPAQFQQLPDEVLMQALVEQLSNQLLLAKAAREAGLDERTPVRLALENQARSVLAGAYMAEEINERVTDAAIAEFYETHFASAEPVEEAHAAHILVEDEATAEEIKAELDEGADFAALAAEHGTDATSGRGGDLGWFGPEEMVPPFAEAVFAMEPGTVSEPVETSFGWHVIKLIETRTRPVPPLGTVREQIATELAETARTEVVGEVREGIDVEVDREAAPAAAIRADDLLDE